MPAEANVPAIKECIAKGIKAFVLAAGGFSEVDEAGKAIQEEIIRMVKEEDIRIIGPNTSGHTSMPCNFTSSFFPLGKLPKGPISYIAQTGNFATHTMLYIKSAENYGIARVVGLGNKVDVDESDILEYYAEDPETKAIFLYLESLKRPKRFIELARQVTRKKPMVMLKGGATSQGANAALAHTASMASDDRIIDAALRQAGVVRIVKYTHLFTAAKAMAMMPLPKGNRVGFLAPSGAMLVCLSDFCHRELDLEVGQIQESTRQRLQEISPPYIRMRNPVDIWPAAYSLGPEGAYREGMEALLKDPNIDAVVPILLISEGTGIMNLEFIPELARKYPEKPIYVTYSGDKQYMDEGKDFLEPRGVAVVPDDRGCIRDPRYRCEMPAGHGTGLGGCR